MQALSNLGSKLFGSPRAGGRPGSGGSPRAVAAAAGSPFTSGPAGGEPRLELFVLGDVDSGTQGLHAASHGTLLFLFEKGAPVEKVAVLGEVPADHPLCQVCPGNRILLPLAHELSQDGWLCGPAAIWAWTERNVPGGRGLGRPQARLSGGEVILGDMASGEQLPEDSLLGALELMLTGHDVAAVAEAERKLQATLKALDDWLAERELAFIGGDEPNATDCYVAAELVHVFLAGNLRNADALGQYPRLERYLEEWKSRGSWEEAGFDAGQVAAFWRHRVAAQGETEQTERGSASAGEEEEEEEGFEAEEEVGEESSGQGGSLDAEAEADASGEASQAFEVAGEFGAKLHIS